MRLTRICASLFALWLPLAALAGPITTFQLENGLDVVVIEDHRAPVAVQMVWYRVGAADEAPGESGVAHFLEHLMFKGTETRAPGAFSDLVEANGGNDNAFTSWDYTAYYQRVAADRLDLMMALEADRMRHLRLDPETVLTERDVILEERSQRTDSDPGALFSEQRRAAQWLNHPYAMPIIGWRHEISELNRETALAFYRKFYAPNNAILIVAVDATPDAVRGMAETHYGSLAPSDDLPPRLRPQEPPQLAERVIRFEDPRVAQPYVLRTYLAAARNPGDQGDAAALSVLAALLGGNPSTSVLGQKLQFETQKAVYATAFYDGLAVDDTAFGVMIAPSEGVSLPEAEAALDQALAEFLREGVDADQFARLKTQVRAEQVYGQDDVQGLAYRYGQGLATGLSLADIEAWPNLLDAVSPDDVMAAAAAVLDKRRAVTGWLSAPNADLAVTQ